MDIAFWTRKLEKDFNGADALQKTLWGEDGKGHHDADGGAQSGTQP